MCNTLSTFLVNLFGRLKAVGLSRHLASSEKALMAAAAELVEDLGAIFIGGAAASDGDGQRMVFQPTKMMGLMGKKIFNGDIT